MTNKKNFSNQETPSIIDDSYCKCNFCQRDFVPIQVNDVWEGRRIFPGDDTPKHFDDCNLINCEVPPGSIVEPNCNTRLVEYDVVVDTIEVEIDGETIIEDVLENIVRV